MAHFLVSSDILFVNHKKLRFPSIWGKKSKKMGTLGRQEVYKLDQEPKKSEKKGEIKKRLCKMALFTAALFRKKRFFTQWQPI